MLLGSDLAAVLSASSSRGTTPRGNTPSGGTLTPLMGYSPASNRRHQQLHLSRQRSPLAQCNIFRPNNCGHFHYDAMELGPVKVALVGMEKAEEDAPRHNSLLTLSIESNGHSWQISRSPSELVDFDRQLHRCVFERRHSRLEELNSDNCNSEQTVQDYASRLSLLTGSLIRCYPVLTFLELDNRGNRFMPAEQCPHQNVPAVACAVAVRPFRALQAGQLTLRVGDIVSLVAPNDGWQEEGQCWLRGKMTVPSSSEAEEDGDCRVDCRVGSFPSDCVRLFSDRLSLGEQLWLASNASGRPCDPSSSASSPLLRRKRTTKNYQHGRSLPSIDSSNLIRSLLHRLTCRPSSSLKAVFGVDLVQLMARRKEAVPEVVEQCVAVLESKGMESGIYRQCGVQSNVRRLRHMFNSGSVPQWERPPASQLLRNDIHSVGSLLKQFFRQLPNPLLPHEFYAGIINAFAEGNPSERELTVRMRQLVWGFPPAHFHTARRLFLHLHFVAIHPRTQTNPHNLAIIWTPNLIRCPPTSSTGCPTAGPQLSGLNLHTDICAFLITFAERIFDEQKENVSPVEETSKVSSRFGSPIGQTNIIIGVSENGNVPSGIGGRVHSVIERPHDQSITGRISLRQRVPPSLVHSVNSLLGWPAKKLRRRDAGNHHLQRRSKSADQTIRPPLEQRMFLPLRKSGFDAVGQRVFRRVRSVRDSVRRFRLSMSKSAPSLRGLDGSTVDVLPSSSFLTHERHQRSNTANGVSPSLHLLGIPFADEANSSTRVSTSASSSTPSPADDVMSNSAGGTTTSPRGRRVNFLHILDGEQLPSSLREEGIGVGIEEGHSRESVDSMPLDISRYDNVGNSVSAPVPPKTTTVREVP